MKTSQAFHQWRHESQRAERHVVFPDGCRDVLIVQKPGEATEILLTDFDFQHRIVSTSSEVAMTGYRLRPGALPCRDAFEAVAADHSQAGSILANACGQSDDIEDVIAALATPGATTHVVARNAGVSIRTLQRQFQTKGLPPPDIWRLLARVRHAALMLAGSGPLAQIAAACGFSDQAHMTRELTRWFGASPAQLRGNKVMLDLLAQPGLGNWTGEQISTR